MMKKKENDHSTQLSIEYPRDFKIIHNKKTTFLVNPLVLSSVSDLFKEKYIKEKITSLEVNDRSSDESFSGFFSLVHGQKVDLTLITSFSILRIAKSWKSSIIQELIEKYLSEKPEIDVKIAEIIDVFNSMDLLPTVNMFNDKVKLLKNMFKDDLMHSIPLNPLNSLLDIAIGLKIDRKIINSFLVDHFQRDPSLKSDFLKYLDYSVLTEENIQYLLSDKRTKNNEKIKEASKHLSLQKEIPHIELSSKLLSKSSKKSKPSKTTKMLSISGPSNEGKQVLKMKEPYIGIFAKISFDSNYEPFKNEFIRVSTTSHDPQNFLNPDNNDDFIITTQDTLFLAKESENNTEAPTLPYPFVIFQLPVSVSITSYEIKNSFKPGSREWTLYGSKSQNEWVVIDNQESPDDIIEPREKIKIDLEKKSHSFSSFKLVSSKYYVEDDAYELIISSVEFFDDDEYSEGVFSKLKSEEKYVNVITSSNNPQVLISPRHKKVWYSTNEPNQSITFEFLKHKVQPTKYTLKSGTFWHPRSWQLSGSFDGKKWFILDKKSNAMQMDRKFVPNVWKIQQDYHICKFLKITQVGTTYDAMNILCLSGIEFFGNVESDENEGKRLKHNMKVFEELRSSRGFRSPRSPRAARLSAPSSPVAKRTLPNISENEKAKTANKNKEESKKQKKEEKEKKKKGDEKTKENDDKKKKENEKKKKEDEKKKKEETEKKKKKDKKSNSSDDDSSSAVVEILSSDFTDSSEPVKISSSEKLSKESETVSDANVTVISDSSSKENAKKEPKSQKKGESKKDDSSESSSGFGSSDFTESSRSTKSTDKEKKSTKSETLSSTDIITVSDTSSEKSKDKKKEESDRTSTSLLTSDFATSSKSTKSSDKETKSAKSEVISTSDVLTVSDASSEKSKDKKKEESDRTSTGLLTSDFATSSKFTKSSDKDKKSTTTTSDEVLTISDSSIKEETKKKDSDSSSKEETKKKDEKSSKKDDDESEGVVIDILSSDFSSDSSKSSDKEKKTKKSDTNSDVEVIAISDSSNKEDKEKKKKKDESAKSEAISTSDALTVSDASSEKSKDKKTEESDRTSTGLLTSDFATSSKSTKSSDKDKKSTTTTSDEVLTISDSSSKEETKKKDSENNNKKEETKSKDSDSSSKDETKKKDEKSSKKDDDESEGVVIDILSSDFSSDSSKSSDKEKKTKKSDTNSDVEVIAISDSSNKEDKEKKKKKTDSSSDDDNKKSDKKEKSSESSDITAIFSSSDSEKHKSDKSDDKDELNKITKVSSDNEVIVISDASSDSNKNDDKKNTKSESETIVDDFLSDPDEF